jgi:acetoin utilization protein AcuB
MLVKYWMSRDPIVIGPDDSMQRATHLLKTHHIGMLPVMKNNDLVGVITDRDLKRASASNATTLEIHELLYLLSKIKVADIMSEPPITVEIHQTIEETAEILMQKKISGAPVVDEQGRLQGVITQHDLYRALISLTGVQGRGLHIALILEDRPGSIMEIANLIREVGGRTVSILTSADRCPQGYRRAYFRIYRLERDNVDWLIMQIRERAQLLYLVDHRENRREVYTA